MLEIGAQTSFPRFYTAVEQAVMSSKNMSVESRVRKLEVFIRQVNQHPKLKELIPLLASPPSGLQVEASADFSITLRGELDRQQVLQHLKQLPKLEPGLYSARLHLKISTPQTGD